MSDPVANIARGMFAVIAMLVYPIELHVAREVTACRHVCGVHAHTGVNLPMPLLRALSQHLSS